MQKDHQALNCTETMHDSEVHKAKGLTQAMEQMASTILLAEENLKKRFNRTQQQGGNPEVDSCFSALEQTALRLSRTAENLDELFCLQSGFYELNKSSFDLALRFENTISLCREALNGNFEIRFSNELTAGELICADIRIVDKILLNLISNAFRTADTLLIELFAEAGYSVVRIQDNGSGFTQEARDHLFEPFSTDFVSNQLGGGIGLGLYLVKEYCKLLDWEIAIKSDAAGTEVLLKIPAAQQGEIDLNSHPMDLALDAEQRSRVDLELSVLKG